MILNKDNSIELILQTRYADEIVAGTKVREYRAVSQFYFSRLSVESKEPKPNFTKAGNKYYGLKHIEFIKFRVGYTGKFFVCRCKGYEAVTYDSLRSFDENRILYDEYKKEKPESLYDLLLNDEEINGDEKDSDGLFIFSLGEIVENNYK
ncbi:MAG: hypothetical protein LBS54_04180 [Dysgonamonadaceae bacterium]|jgi:hypothetical protein|nr:hypothetical protein [Dysgonamonadaceae bacterium]